MSRASAQLHQWWQHISYLVNSPKMTRGPLLWVITLLLVVVFLLPYFLFPHLFTALSAYNSLALLPLGLAAHFRARHGALLTWGLILLGITCSLWITIGLHWSSSVINEYIFSNGVGLVVSLIIAQSCQLHRQVIIAGFAAQVKDLQAAQQREVLAHQQYLNELKDQLILNLGHELRTPLTEVFGYLELLSNHRQELDDAQQAAFLGSAEHGCTELLELLNTLLDVTLLDQQSQGTAVERLSVAQCVQAVVEQWNPVIWQHYTLALDVPEGLTIWADAQSVRRILRNLLSNAFKYSPPQSQVLIRATLHETGPYGTSASPQVCICVKDAGLGISPHEIPLLFRKFVRLQRDLAGNVRGTGLGLYICKQLVEAMQGHIWVESSGRAGEGSCFCFTLPSPSPWTPLPTGFATCTTSCMD